MREPYAGLLVLVIVAMVLFGYGVVQGQGQAKPREYHPTETQALRLRVKQLEAQLSGRDLTQAQEAFLLSSEAFHQECRKIVAENHWPVDTTCNEKNLSFSTPPAPVDKIDPKVNPSAPAPAAPAPGKP